MPDNELQDFGQTPPDSGQVYPYPGNCQEIASTDFPDHRTDSDVRLTDANQCRNPKNAQALPKISPSILVENKGDILNKVSIHHDELSEITNAWPMLSDDVRAGILAIIRTMSQKSENT